MSPDATGGPEARLPAPLRSFLALYRAGRFWDSHEALEDAWRDSGSAFYQGLILYASAWVHRERGNAHGVRAQLEKALARLDGYPDAYLGLDVAKLREHCDAVRRDVAGGGGGSAERATPLPLAVSEERIRGDEDELRGG